MSRNGEIITMGSVVCQLGLTGTVVSYSSSGEFGIRTTAGRIVYRRAHQLFKLR